MPAAAAAVSVKPSDAQIVDDITHIVAGFAHMPAHAIDKTWVLRDPPLVFDDNRLAFLAMSVRGYVQSYNPQGTIKADDTRTQGLTVGGLGNLAVEQVG